MEVLSFANSLQAHSHRPALSMVGFKYEIFKRAPPDQLVLVWHFVGQPDVIDAFGQPYGLRRIVSTRRVIPGRGGRDPVQQPGLGHPSGNHEQAFLHQSLGRAQTMDPRVFRLHAIWIFFVVIRLQGVFSPPDPEHPAAYSRVQESIDRVERLGTPFHHAHSAAPRAKLQLPRYYCGFKDGTGLLGGLDHAIASHGYSSENTALSCRASSCSSAPIASRALVHHVKKIAAVYKVPPSSERPCTRYRRAVSGRVQGTAEQ